MQEGQPHLERKAAMQCNLQASKLSPEWFPHHKDLAYLRSRLNDPIRPPVTRRVEMQAGPIELVCTARRSHSDFVPYVACIEHSSSAALLLQSS